jgi:hypothetical protein
LAEIIDSFGHASDKHGLWQKMLDIMQSTSRFRRRFQSVRPNSQERLSAMSLPKRSLYVFSFVVLSGFALTDDVFGGDYVWARSAWGNGSWGRNYGGMSNGYGGYYVPRNGYGNNYESRRPFTNPNGYIIPANAGSYQPHQQRYVRVQPAQPQYAPQAATVVPHPAVTPHVAPQTTTSPVTNTTNQTAPSAPAPIK